MIAKRKPPAQEMFGGKKPFVDSLVPRSEPYSRIFYDLLQIDWSCFPHITTKNLQVFCLPFVCAFLSPHQKISSMKIWKGLSSSRYIPRTQCKISHLATDGWVNEVAWLTSYVILGKAFYINEFVDNIWNKVIYKSKKVTRGQPGWLRWYSMCLLILWSWFQAPHWV